MDLARLKIRYNYDSMILLHHDEIISGGTRNYGADCGV